MKKETTGLIEKQQIPSRYTPAVGSGNFLLPIALDAAIRLRLMEFERQDGPTSDDWYWCSQQAPTLAWKGDTLMYGGDPGEAASLFNTTARAVAILAFAPGGIRFMGHHYQGHYRAQG